MDSKRKAPFTAFEKELLREIAAKHLSIIECKKTDATFNKNKLEAWIAITAEFNASPQVQEATHQQLKKLWLNMKTRARDVKTAARQRMHTGGGPYIPEPPVEDDMLGDMLSSIKVLPTIKVVKDSDGCGDIEGDDDDTSWAKKWRTSPELILTPPKKMRSTSPATQQRDITPERERSSQKQFTCPAPVKKTIKPPLRNDSAKPTSTTIDSLKIKLIEDDISQREQRFQMDSAQSAKINELKLKILRLEYAHKKRLYKMVEEEQALKIQKAKMTKKLNFHVNERIYRNLVELNSSIEDIKTKKDKKLPKNIAPSRKDLEPNIEDFCQDEKEPDSPPKIPIIKPKNKLIKTVENGQLHKLVASFEVL